MLLANVFVIQISCVSASTELSNRMKYRRYFQLLPPADITSFGYYGIIKAFKWKQVSLIVQNVGSFLSVSDEACS